MVAFCGVSLVTLMMRRSPSLAYTTGPGSMPFTVIFSLVLQILVILVVCIFNNAREHTYG